MPIPDEFGCLALKRSVEKLFSSSFFSICTFDNIAELLNVTPCRKIERQLRAYHCADFATMSDKEKELLQVKVIEALRGDKILNPARLLSALTDEGRDFAFTEDRYLDQAIKRIN